MSVARRVRSVRRPSRPATPLLSQCRVAGTAFAFLALARSQSHCGHYVRRPSSQEHMVPLLRSLSSFSTSLCLCPLHPFLELLIVLVHVVIHPLLPLDLPRLPSRLVEWLASFEEVR